MLYRPRIQINFGKQNKFHLYHSEGGERFINNCTRLNVVFIFGNSLLLLLELISPFFGYWHGVSLSVTLMFSGISAYMLNYYSRRMIQDMYLLPDGKHIEVTFFNAFWIPKTQKMRIMNLGYFQPSRIYNVSYATYQQKQKVYINLERNMYKNPEYDEMLKRLLMGQEFSFIQGSDVQTSTVGQVVGGTEVGRGKIIKPKKSKKYD